MTNSEISEIIQRDLPGFEIVEAPEGLLDSKADELAPSVQKLREKYGITAPEETALSKEATDVWVKKVETNRPATKVVISEGKVVGS